MAASHSHMTLSSFQLCVLFCTGIVTSPHSHMLCSPLCAFYLLVIGKSKNQSLLLPVKNKPTQPQIASLFETNRLTPKTQTKKPFNTSEAGYHLKGRMQECTSSFADPSPQNNRSAIMVGSLYLELNTRLAPWDPQYSSQVTYRQAFLAFFTKYAALVLYLSTVSTIHYS